MPAAVFGPMPAVVGLEGAELISDKMAFSEGSSAMLSDKMAFS